MTDNSNPTLPATGVGVRAIDRANEATAPPAAASGITQVVQLDVAGATGPESLVSDLNPMPTQDVGIAAAQSTDTPLGVFLTGDPNSDFAGVNIIEQLVDDGSGLALNVKLITPLFKSGKDGGLMLSDAITVPLIGATTAQVFIFDTQGYASFQAQSPGTGGQGTIQFSSDQVNWVAGVLQVPGNASAVVTSGLVTQGFQYSGPIFGRYLRYLPTVNGTMIITLRQAQWVSAMPNANLFIAGSAAAASTLTGSLTVGGGIASAGLASAGTNPVVVGGADAAISAAGASAPLIRRMLTDSSGRQVTAPLADPGAHPTANIPGRQQGAAQITTLYNNTAANVQDTTQLEGQSIVELLGQILLELRIANQLTYEMSALINGLQLAPNISGVQSGNMYLDDDPAAYRAEPSIFNQ